MPTEFRPLNDNVLVRRLEPEQRSAGGLFLPTQAQEKQLVGIVLSVGKGLRAEDGTRFTIDIEVNDKVMFDKYAGTEIELDGEKLLVLSEKSVLGVVTQPK